MRKFYSGVVKYRKLILSAFIAAAIVCGGLKSLVAVNYDMNDYLPENAKSTAVLNVMSEEFGGGIPNARVMVKYVTIPESLRCLLLVISSERIMPCPAVPYQQPQPQEVRYPKFQKLQLLQLYLF